MGVASSKSPPEVASNPVQVAAWHRCPTITFFLGLPQVGRGRRAERVAGVEKEEQPGAATSRQAALSARDPRI